MGNKVVALACAFLNKHPSMRSLEDFRAKFANLPRVAPPACVEREIENIASREFARRIEAARPPEEVEAADGTKVLIRRKGRSEPTPLTSFMLADRGRDAPPLYFSLRPTKGWRWERLDAYDAKAYKKQGVRTYDKIPNRRQEIKRRRVM